MPSPSAAPPAEAAARPVAGVAPPPPPPTSSLSAAPPAAAPLPATYVIQAGDTITAIARRFSLDPVALSQLNGIPWNATIWVGQVLRLQ